MKHLDLLTTLRWSFVSQTATYAFLFLLSGPSHAQAPITASGLDTQVNRSSPVQYDITGGTRAGANLFHSFGNFNVPTNDIANFLNDSGLPTSNILGRITGGNVSNIFGTIGRAHV